MIRLLFLNLQVLTKSFALNLHWSSYSIFLGHVKYINVFFIRMDDDLFVYDIQFHGVC